MDKQNVLFDQSAAVENEDTLRGKFLTFLIDKEEFGIDIRYVTEIIGVLPTTFVPEVPAYVKGVINLRGKVVPVIDVRLRFKKESVEYDDRTCIIVINIKDIEIGLIVDSVSEVVNIKDENIMPPPNYHAGFQNPYIEGIGQVGDKVKMLIDCEKIISAKELETLGGIE